MHCNRRKWSWIGALGLTALAVAALVILRHLAQRTLLDRATRITEAPRQYAPGSNLPTHASGHYLWLSDHEVLCLIAEGSSDHAYRLDTRTGQKTPLETLNAAFRAVTPNGETHLSPDGRRLLWTGVRHAQNVWPPSRSGINTRYVLPRPGNYYQDFRVMVTALDGSQQIDRQQGGNLAWQPDNRGWMRLIWGNGAPRIQTQTLDSPRLTEQTLSDVTETVLKAPGGTYGTRGGLQILGVTPNQHLLTASPAPLLPGQVYFYDMALTPAARPSRTYTVSLPGNYYADTIALSPSGDRLAWKLYGHHRSSVSFLNGLLWHLFPNLAQSPQPVIGLWVSRLDGTGMHEVGEMPVPRQDGWNLSLSDLSWTPDGKRLSFTYDGALWTVPIRP